MKQLVATFFGTGLVPAAQGTAGSAAAVLFGIAVYELGGAAALSAAAALAAAAGFWSTAVAAQELDPPEIVIDEAAGQLLAALPVPLFLHSQLLPGNSGIFAWLAAFALFRLFDIWKPGLIGRIDRAHGPGSIMLDDLCAGAAAAFILLAVWLALRLLTA